jgi:hypothetical protein
MDISEVLAGKPLWNSLEVAKLAISTLTPLSILALSAILTRRATNEAVKRQRAEQEQAAETTRYSKVIEKRVELWDKIGPALNDIYAYNTYVGNWNNMTADDIITTKRNCDKEFFSYHPFFSKEFSDAYDDFMKASFSMFGGMGVDAKIRTSGQYRKDSGSPRFTGTPNDEVYQAYSRILEIASKELGVTGAPLSKPREPDNPGRAAGIK